MIKKIVISVLTVFALGSLSYGAIDYLDKLEMEAPVVKHNKIMDMLEKADKWRTSPDWRYQPHITHRYYYDCSYYRYVNCKDMRFGRCWQCRDYVYKYTY